MTVEIVRRAAGFMKMGRAKPVWFDTIAHRHPPLTFTAPKAVRANAGHRPKNSPEPIWRPPKLVYPEDKYVRKIHESDPLQKLRPMTLSEQEDDRHDATREIIKQQLGLMESGLSPDAAFQKASERFWEEQARREIAEKVAREEARYSQEQVDACSGRRSYGLVNRHESVGQTIRQMLLAEKKAMLDVRKNEDFTFRQ